MAFEEFVAATPTALLGESGKVFYAGRAAFSAPSDIYILGLNPGGDPSDPRECSVQDNIRFVSTEVPDLWSAYQDEAWKRWAPGDAPLQRRLQHLFHDVADLRTVPSSNLIFVRSRRETGLGAGAKELEDLCWPFHETVLRRLPTKVIVCLGNSAGRRVRRRVGTIAEVDRFVEQNERRWTSRTHRNPTGMAVVTLTHPGVADWTTSAADPSALLRRALHGEGGRP